MIMKRILITLIIALASISLSAKDYQVRGPEGGLSMKLTLPENFDTQNDSCHLVILMHGIFSSKDFTPMPAIAKELAQAGIASISFDFNGHGKSEGRLQDMTIAKEIADALAMWEYARSLPYVSGIGLLGHSQGGVIASMSAGIISSDSAKYGPAPYKLVLLAPGSVIKEACQGGRFFNATFDPTNPPEAVNCIGGMKLGREYLLSTQKLDIYGTAKAYTGPVRLIHGDEDNIVPMWCSEKFVQTYGDASELIVVKGENHMITKKLNMVVKLVVEFFK